MALPSTLIKFRLFNADGSAAVGLHVSARITRPDTDDGAVVPSISVSADSDAAGECTLALWPNARGTTGSQYSVTISRGSQTVDNYTITVPESGSMVLVESIKSAPPYPSVSAAQQALEAAQAATVVAQGHATSATTQAGIAASAAADAAQSAADAVSVIPVGGTTGQVLAKASDADLDTEWVPQTGGGGGGATNLAYTASPTGGTVTSDTGTDATIPLADGTNAGLMTPAQKATLDATSGANTGDQDLSGYSQIGHNHTGIYDPAGTAASAVSAHEGAADPHPGYVLESALGSAAAANTTDFAPAAHVGAGASAHANAIAAGAAGFMSGTDKSKLDGIDSGAQVNPTDTDGLSEGSTNLYHTAARVLGQVLTGLSTAAGTVVTSAHTVLQAIGFLQKQVSDNTTAIGGKQAALVSGTNIKSINGTSVLGSGDLSVSASPGGSDLDIQRNNAGAFAGSPLKYVDASTVETRNGTTASEFRFGYFYVDASNYSALSIKTNTGNAQILPKNVGTGILTVTSVDVGFSNTKLARFEDGTVTFYGLHLRAGGADTYDVGASGTRFRTGYFKDVNLSGVLKLSSFTVATLPSASTSGGGSLAYVTDANATTPRSTVAGGGSNKVQVMSDGTNWLIVA